MAFSEDKLMELYTISGLYTIGDTMEFVFME